MFKGIILNLSGDANDYAREGGCQVGLYQSKNIKIAITDQNIIAGNTLLYGAISGECYINGVVGKDLLRNSGATAIVECGDHGEYMTGG